jgi:hypothetical protein
MLTARALATAAFVIGFLANGPKGQDLSQYRNFALGSDLASVSTLAGVVRLRRR